ncbi:hypothetical protein DEO72_LG2g4337 [Vigna unguiculata]|uniref:Uncharacterized protein n=1 Tax=Vigna unguiculata TaxID=3917 RepID=A0A4D6L675_VIGUN|nr:hypothetical protein DEO72_LG2g4337 [Vigna unguiculata]
MAASCSRDCTTAPIPLTAARPCLPGTTSTIPTIIGVHAGAHSSPNLNSLLSHERSVLGPVTRCHHASHRDWVRKHQGNQPSGHRDNDCFCTRL